MLKERKEFISLLVLSLCLMVAFGMMILPTSQASAASLAKPKISVAAFNGKVRISIKKVKKAQKYQIYRASKKSGKYKRVKITTKTRWIDGAKGTRYYKVRAVKGKKKSSFSSIKRIYGGVTAYIAGARGQTTVGAGPVTTVMVKIKNNTGRPLYVLGSTKDGKAYSYYSYFIYALQNGKLGTRMAPESGIYKSWLSTADGGFNVYCQIIKPRKTQYVYMSFTDLRASTSGWAYYAEYVNDRTNYYTAVYPYFSTKKPKANNPLKTSGKYMLGASTMGWFDGYVKAN